MTGNMGASRKAVFVQAALIAGAIRDEKRFHPPDKQPGGQYVEQFNNSIQDIPEPNLSIPQSGKKCQLTESTEGFKNLSTVEIVKSFKEYIQSYSSHCLS
jgi:hypothetical protein